MKAELSSNDVVEWLDERVAVIDVGEHISDVDGTHVMFESPSDHESTTVVHGRLIDDWFANESKNFRVVN